MQSEFSFRLNGQAVPFVFVNRERVNGKLTGRRHVAVYIDGVGRFEIDNDESLWAESFAESVLEYRNDTQRENAAEEDGWQQVTPSELVQVLADAGLLDFE